MSKKIIGELCQTDSSGIVKKTVITTDNYRLLKSQMHEVDIELLSKRKNLSYRQYCKLFDGYLHKEAKCNGRVCCQALTNDGTRCKRPANNFVSIDLTEKQLVPKIPLFLQKKLGAKKVEKLKLLGFSNNCCFYCWQHAAMYIVEGATYTSNLAYYLSHPESILTIFFKNVKTRKIFNIITYSIEVSQMRNPHEIIKYMYKTSADMEGVLSSYYWAIFLMIFAYDKIEPRLRSIIQSKRPNIIENMSITAANTLIEFES